ncbi:MAG: hypothetical protein AAF633_02885, partial [Chloroflexota bacterium]
MHLFYILLTNAGFAQLGAALSGAWIPITLLIIAAVGSAIFLFIKKGQVQVNELEFVAVFDRQQDSFSHFLPSGEHWINPWRKEVRGAIATGGYTAKGSSKE